MLRRCFWELSLQNESEFTTQIASQEQGDGFGGLAVIALLSFCSRNSQRQETRHWLSDETESLVKYEWETGFAFDTRVSGLSLCPTHLLLSQYRNWVLNIHNGFLPRAPCCRYDGELFSEWLKSKSYFVGDSFLPRNLDKTLFSRQPGYLVPAS